MICSLMAFLASCLRVALFNLLNVAMLAKPCHCIGNCPLNYVDIKAGITDDVLL